MELTNINEFVANKLKASEIVNKNYRGENIRFVKFLYNKKVPLIRVDGKFKIYKFLNEGNVSYSLSIDVGDKNFYEMHSVIERESSIMLSRNVDLKFIRETSLGNSVFAKIYTTRGGKPKCRVSIGSKKNIVDIDELVEETFHGTCVVELLSTSIGKTNSIVLAVREIFAREVEKMESYLDSDSEDDLYSPD